MQVLNPYEILRLYAKTFDKEKLSDKIKPISNYKDHDFVLPSLSYLYSFRVVVCTLATVACITRARGQDKDFNSSHFSHIIIDESACVPEPMLLTAIAGAIFSSIFFQILFQFIQFIHTSILVSILTIIYDVFHLLFQDYARNIAK